MKTLPVLLSALTMSEKFALSGEMLLRGLGTVFMVLMILWGVLALFSVVFSSKDSKKKKAVPAPAPAPIKAEEPAETEAVTEEYVPADDNGALIAAITAAVEAYRAEESGTEYALPFRVVSFKRKNSSWNKNSLE